MQNFKIIILGPGGVGKSALTQRFISGNFIEAYDPTIEDCYLKTVKYKNKEYKLEILDTAGTDQFTSLRDVYINSGDAFVVVYSIDSISSFNDIQSIIDQICTIKESDPSPLIIVGNKCDLDEDREISEEMGEMLANSSRCSFIETSAKLDLNIKEIFYDLLSQLINKRASMTSFQTAYEENEDFKSVIQTDTATPTTYKPKDTSPKVVESAPEQKHRKSKLCEDLCHIC
ncbi:unnamed protein product [Brachionus calyciflorus]|uniref:Uncharacterized protein n=1 Tax=Brachionus calyciflorus TaxID=104777 RepID=A0A813RVQ3_9BILA|nr:unnamed protein product [Brachionus calyciflorus]